MHVIRASTNVGAILQMYGLVASAPEIVNRGAASRNVHNLAIILNSREPVITNFRHRKMNLNYAKREWLWYLGADPMDDSICQYATAWAKLKQADGSFYSNYGQYLFGVNNLANFSQFMYVLQTLEGDPQSRRASMVLLRRERLYSSNTDVVCTYAINFFIERDHLQMTVMMRSNDVIWGFTNDAFCFWLLHLYVYASLSRRMPNLQLGTYTHMANSMHVYARHYDMIQAILDDPTHMPVYVPMPSYTEALELVYSCGNGGSGDHSKWLKTFD